MAERLCTDCILRNTRVSGVEASLEYARTDAENEDDRQSISTLPNADELMSALRLSRPERCARIAELIAVPQHTRAHGVRFAECPEMALAGMLVDLEMEVDFVITN